ncbi:DNA-binding domain-containing protein [Pararhodobacter zhoushanensis]|uniref:HvfC/BufC N-terminal domain-containing protein n=1 Tax=Pararhodobacter zhoushanensis TaxID=2479545 RepID=UPI000F8D8E21|nr:putative DNA-binding domain-containing protein [Pararhodobacter zhoushanensis]
MHTPPDHATTQARLHAALWSPQTPQGLGEAQALDRRFAVYRNNVQHGLSRALAARFPVIERLVGPDFFAATARVFAAQHPPQTPVLLDWGDSFPDFLATFPPAQSLPYLPDVARLEWLRGEAYHAADAARADPSALATVDPARLRLTLAPSVRAYAAQHPAVSLWHQNQPGARPAPLPKGPQYALIARTPGFAVTVDPLARDQHTILTNLLSGQPFARAATTDPTPLLALLIRHQLIAQIGETP